MAITVDEAVYRGLWLTIGMGNMCQFTKDLLHPHVLGNSHDVGYKAMA
jgi:hypothetical protein